MIHIESYKNEVFKYLQSIFSNLEQQKIALDTSAIVAITNIKGEITYVNDKFCETSKYSKEELLGENHRIINSGYHNKKFFQNLYKTIAQGKVWSGEIRNRAKDNSFYWVYTTIVPYMNDQEKPYQYVSVRFDITNQKKMELELKHRNKQLADFVFIVSHNLRAPLTNLLVLTSMIQESETLEDQKLLIDKLSKPVQHLNETFSELVASLQVTQNTGINKESLSFQKYLNSTIITLNINVLHPDITLISDFEKAPNIYYPKKYLISILHNLISNAIKYRSPERPLVIEVSTYIKHGGICLEIKDNGTGLDMKAYGKKLFGLQKTFHGNHDAKGFGLFMTKSQIESMGGSITAKSTLGLGLTFYAQLTKNNGYE